MFKWLMNLFTPSVEEHDEAGNKLPDYVIEARKLALKDRLQSNLDGFEICIADYEDQATLDYVKRDNEWALSFNRAVMLEYSREVKRRGGKTFTYVIRLGEYLDWLERRGLRNSEEARKRYVKWLHRG